MVFGIALVEDVGRGPTKSCLRRGNPLDSAPSRWAVRHILVDQSGDVAELVVRAPRSTWGIGLIAYPWIWFGLTILVTTWMPDGGLSPTLAIAYAAPTTLGALMVGTVAFLTGPMSEVRVVVHGEKLAVKRLLVGVESKVLTVSAGAPLAVRAWGGLPLASVRVALDGDDGSRNLFGFAFFTLREAQWIAETLDMLRRQIESAGSPDAPVDTPGTV